MFYNVESKSCLLLFTFVLCFVECKLIKMINVKELRVGNFVVANDKGWAVGTIDWFKNEVVLYNMGLPAIKETFKADEIHPIPVSNEWLESLSVKNFFEERSYDYYYDMNDKYLCQTDSNGQSEGIAECIYVHNLQNVWFILNNKDLKMKTN
tara:strand:+ start:909 stop:1364 length:456 start_codon:yes stop_codon:yes gene_type:complete